MAHSSLRRIIVGVTCALVALPLLADAAPRYGYGYRPGRSYVPPSRVHYGRVPGDHIYHYGYRQDSTLLLTPSGSVWAVPTVTPVPSNGSSGAPLHGTVCSKGTIAELPLERQHLYTDGAAVGLPGQRCMTFDQQ